jgi:hypothetical protein
MPSLRILRHSRESEEEELAAQARIADRLANLFSDRLVNGLAPEGAVPTGIDEAGVAQAAESPHTEPSAFRPRRRRATSHADPIGPASASEQFELVGVMGEPSEVAPEWVLPGNDADLSSVEAPGRRAPSLARSRRSLALKAKAVRINAKASSDLVELVGVMAQPCDDVATPDLALVEGGLVSARVATGDDAASAAPEAALESAPEAAPEATLEPAPEAPLEAALESAPEAPETSQLSSATLPDAASPGLDEPAQAALIEAEPPEPAQAPIPELSVSPPGRSRGAAERAGSAPAARTRSTAKPKKPRKGAAIVATAACPYCGLLLQPPPESSRRCTRCLQRIVVKHVEGRTIYLTEAALVVFEAQRRRQASSGRFIRERARWLKLAEAAAAPPERIARLAAAFPSEEGVAAARTLYMGTVDRAFRAAKRDNEWETASRMRRKQVADLYRIAGSPMPPPADLVALFREGVMAELRGIAEVARNAELVSASCCDVCRADDRRYLRISVELREPRLPHEGCPKGFCRCGWTLAARDRTAIREYIRRGPRI